MTNGRWGRRLLHLLGGSFFPIVALFSPRELVLLVVGGASTLAVLGEGVRFTYPRFNHWLLSHASLLFKPQEHLEVTGSTYLLLASWLTFAIFPQPVALTALLFLAWGDPMAAAVGERWGSPRLGQGKSLQGSLAFALTAVGLGLAFRPLTGLSLEVLLVGGLAAALTELLTLGVDDNLAIPLISAGSMTLAGAYGQG